jgi:hypothetical protein
MMRTLRRSARLARHARTNPKRAWRLVAAIVRKGDTAPVVLLLVLNLTLSGCTLLTAQPTSVFNLPQHFGAAFLLLAGFGLAGLLARDYRWKAAFGAVGLFLRLWMATRYFMHDWHDPVWCSFALGAIAFAWIWARSACRHVWVRTRREMSVEMASA